MHLSKSKYCSGLSCYKVLWLEEHKKEEKEEIDKESVFENGTEVGELAKNLFGNHIDISFNKDLTKMIEDTKKALEKENVVITEASFHYQDNFCSIDILRKEKDTYEIYEVKSSTSISNIYLEDISYQYYILKNLGYNIKSANIVYINKNYTRKGKLDLNKLFIIKNVTDIVLEKEKEVENRIKEMDAYVNQVKEPTKLIDEYCFKPYSCPYFKYCTKHLPEKNVFNIKRMQTKAKIKLYQQGLDSYEKLLHAPISPQFKEQIEFDLYQKEDKINKKEIKEFLNTLSYPLYFLDFETYQESIPKYDGIKPYMQIPFQYSLHFIENDKLELKHKEFLSKSGIDPRRGLAEKLVKDIPQNACILAYNSKFERMVIKTLADLYPDLKEKLLKIEENIKDLMMPFYNRDYYTKEMEGSYSIKSVLPALYPNDPELNYHNLNIIHNGEEAMNSYATLDALSKEEQQKIRESLLKYCELDTYAMVKIWEKLQAVCTQLVEN